MIVSFIFTQIQCKAFSGGQPTTELHKLNGGDCDVDVAYQYLKFLCKNDVQLEKLREEYKSGVLLAGGMKSKSIEIVVDELMEYQTTLETNSEDVHQLKTIRRLDWNR